MNDKKLVVLMDKIIKKKEVLKMKTIKDLEELLCLKVSIYDQHSEQKIDTVEIWQIMEGFDHEIEIEKDSYILVDLQDESDKTDLGNTIEQALLSLNGYIEYFNNYGYNDDCWYSDFLECNEHYLQK